jgi:nucleotide sugar dehydrogenase
MEYYLIYKELLLLKIIIMKIGIVGSGRLGICMALCLDNAGYDVYCYDINKILLDNIINKTLETNEPKVKELLLNSKLKVLETEKDIVQTCDIIFIFIQTPSKKNGEYEHSYIDYFLDKIKNITDDEKIIVISSTVMPEYTDSVINNIEENIKICYNPTFIAQGSIIDNLTNPEIILLGSYSKKTTDIIQNIHKKIIKNNADIHIMTPIEAEIAKISINCFITSKITYANMIGDLLISKNINPSNVLNAIGSDTRIGNKYLSYGFGFGGPCLPRDNKALYIYSKNNNFNFRICETTDILNYEHLLFQFNSIIKYKTDYEFTYITYKDSSDILEESQKLKLAIMLVDAGINVTIKERSYIINILKDLYRNKFTYFEIE